MKRFLPALIAAITLIASGALVAQNNLVQHYQIAPTIKHNNPQTLSDPTSFRARSTNRPLKSRNTSGANTALIFQQLQQAAISSNRKAPDSRYGIPPLISTKQLNALKVLNKQSSNNKNAFVYFDSKSGTPAFIKLDSNPPNISARGSRDEISKASAMHFLRANKDLLKLENPATELELVHTQKDSYGKQHFQYRQMFAGIPVWGSDLKLHLKPDNSFYLMNGRFQPTITNLDTTPSITQADAEENVLKDLNATWVAAISSDLMIYKKQSGEAVLTYKVEVQPSMAERWIYFIDAIKGEVIHKINNIQEVVVAGQGQDSNGDLRNFNAWSEGGLFYMVDPTTPLNDPIHDPINETKPLGDTYIWDARNSDRPPFFYSTSNSVNSSWDPVAVSAMANTKIVYDYYINTHGRQSTDDNNKNLMVAIHFDNNLGNAFWNGTFMVYGDGDGTIFGPLARCLDVAAHEMTHGVVETTARLIYENQSGALNESFSDIFGAMVDRDDWLIGEDCTIASPGYLRNMQDPSKSRTPQPTKMSEYQNLPNTPSGDNGGVHVNSGIPNRVAYLIAEGLTSEGSGTSIGKNKMEQIFYRALTTYLTSSSQFIDARRATIQAAEDIHGTGSAEVQAVARGWDVVELVEGSQPTPNNPNPTPTDAISGSDIMIYLYPVDGTRDFAPNDLYTVKLQSMNDPLVYDSALDTDLLNTVSAASSVRPVVFTDSSGSYIYYIGSDSNIYEINFQTGVEFSVTTAGNVWSLAISNDGNYATYTTTDFTDNNIYVLDLVNSTEAIYPIIPPNFSEGNSPTLNTAQYADSMSFDYTGKFIIFDFLNCLTTQQSTCASGGGYRYWSIGKMDVTTGLITFPFPAQNPNFDLGYPSFAQNNNFLITLDFSDYSTPGSVLSQVHTFNFNAQETGLVHDFGASLDPVFGIPSFWGNDDFITIQFPSGGQTGTAGTIAQRVALGTNGDNTWEGSNGVMSTINPFAVAMPQMYRLGVRTLTGSLQASTNNVNFGELDFNTISQRTITLSNNGNSDINITSINITGSNFSHNGTNTPLPSQSSITLKINFNAGFSRGTKIGNITFTTDSDPSALSISLVGSSRDFTGDANILNAAFSGGGSVGLLIYVLFIIPIGVQLHRYRTLRK